MNILWISHTHWNSKTYRRDNHLINYLKKRNKISVLTWEGKESVNLLEAIIFVLRTFKFFIYEEEGIKIYHIPRFMGIGIPWRFPFRVSTKINEYIFNRYLKSIILKENIDVLIVGPNAPLIGYPKIKSVSIVFDFLDCSNWETENEWSLMEKKYFQLSNGILCVSDYAFKIASRFNKNVVLLPNGVEIDKFYKKNKENAKKKLGFQDKKIISLIGATFGNDDYFIKAILNVLKAKEDVIFILIGYNDKVEKFKKKYIHPRILYIDYIPYSKIFDYFIATDIGIYPADDNAWFHGALPLKVLEYTAAGCWVLVSPELVTIKSLNFENIVFSMNNPNDFEDKLKFLIGQSTPEIDYKKIMKYSWDKIGETLDKYLVDLLGKKF